MGSSGSPDIKPRQLELIAMIASGSTVDAAADAVHIAPQSAYNTLSSARSKVRAKTIPHLIAIALTHNWIILTGDDSFSPDAMVMKQIQEA